MKKYSFIYIVLIGLLIQGCATQQEKDLTQIREAEKELYDQTSLDRTLGTNIIDQYLDYASNYQEDTLSPVFLFKAGEIAMNLNLGSQSILYFNKVLSNYPEFNKAPECVFLKGFVYENQLGNLKEAEAHYNLFIEKYPQHPMVKDAKASLRYLGKSPEELIKIFQEQQEQNK